MENTTKLLDRIRDYNNNAPDRRHHLIEPRLHPIDYIATLAYNRNRPLSPMLRARFDYCGTWHDADLNQNWLSQTAISHYRNNPTLAQLIKQRIRNWDWTPPGCVARQNCAIFGYSDHEQEETYLVWEDGVEEPAVWRYTSAHYNRFDNLDRYLEYILGDRLQDDSPPTKKTYEEYIAEARPTVEKLAEDYAALGVAKPMLWAESESLGENGYAESLFGYALRREVGKPDDHSWAETLLDGTVNVENEALLAEAAQAVRYLQECGIDIERLTPMVRALQSQSVRNIVSVLADRPEVARLPLPNGRKARWGVYHVEPDGTVGKPIGVRAVVNDPEVL